MADYLNSGDWTLLGEYVEVESERKNDRPELLKALEHCRLTGAKLVIAKLDRLSRNAHFLIGLQEAGVPFVAAYMPNANELTVGIMALVAREERKATHPGPRPPSPKPKSEGASWGAPPGRHTSGNTAMPPEWTP